VGRCERGEKIRGTNDEIMTISQGAAEYKKKFFGRVFHVNMQKKRRDNLKC
jgi:hypothetical protein